MAYKILKEINGVYSYCNCEHNVYDNNKGCYYNKELSKLIL